MSIIIKGMEMPRNSHTVTITVTGHGKVYVEYYDCRPHLAETIAYTAIPVPPHGRLIDADALPRIKFHDLPYPHITPSDVDAESYERGWNDVIDAIVEDAPTIIEAEGGKE